MTDIIAVVNPVKERGQHLLTKKADAEDFEVVHMETNSTELGTTASENALCNRGIAEGCGSGANAEDLILPMFPGLQQEAGHVPEDIFSSDEDLCADDLAVNFLEEEERNDPYPHPDYDPDDPGIPNIEAGNEDSESEEEQEDSHFSIDDESLNMVIDQGQRTRREILLLNLAVASKNNATYEMLIDMLCSWNIVLQRPGMMPESKKLLRKLLKRSDAGINKHAYCPEADCKKYLGKLQTLLRLGEPVHCDCGKILPLLKLKWFISLSLKNQLKQFLALPNILNLLNYRETREKFCENGIEDIFDGDLYRELVTNGLISNNDNNYTYVFNTDGFSLFRQNLSIWVLLVRINELPPVLRQHHLFLGGLWIDKAKPNMNAFLRPFVKQLNKLSTQGIQWQANNGLPINSKFFPVGCCCDAQARCIVMNMKQYNGEYGCFLCNHQGIHLGGSNKYPLLPFENLPDAQNRTDQTIRASMQLNQAFEGQLGPSQIMLLNHFDLARGNGLDDLHVFYEGIASFLFEVLIPLMDREEEALRIIDFRMKAVRTPTLISRKWKSIRKRRTFKGSQWGTFIRYFAVFCLMDNNLDERYVELVSLLSYSLFVLSRDSITPDELNCAEGYIRRFLQLYQDFFGPINMRANIHFLSHSIESVRALGPTWAISCFNFESWNYKLGKQVTSPKGVFDQIVDRHLMKTLLRESTYRNDISEDIRQELQSLLFASERKVAREVDGVVLLGNAKPRQAHVEEQRLLQEVGIACDWVVEYDRVLVRGVEYRNKRYLEESLSDNSHALTWDNKFLTIVSIVLVQNNGQHLCKLLVEEHTANYPLYFAHHIAQVTATCPACIQPKKLRVPAIKMNAQNKTYMVPMANCWEID